MNKAKTITKAQQRANAASRMESAAAELIEASEVLAGAASAWQRRLNRIELLAKARKYVRALDALSRIG